MIAGDKCQSLEYLLGNEFGPEFRPEFRPPVEGTIDDSCFSGNAVTLLC